MSEYASVHLTSAIQLRRYNTIRLRSSKGDYLHRPDGPSGVTTWPGGELDWGVEPAESGRFRLKSWKGDYLHRPDGPPGVTTWPGGEIEWTVEVVDGAIRLKSWKGDYLCRVVESTGVTTADTGALDWSVERKWSSAESSAWKAWLAMLLQDRGLAAGGIYGQQDGACCAASSGLAITASVAQALGAGVSDPAPLKAAGIMIGGRKFMFLTVAPDPVPALILRKGSVSALVVNSLHSTIVALTAEGANPANVTGHLQVADKLTRQGF